VQACYKIPALSQFYRFRVTCQPYSSRMPPNLYHILPNGSEDIGFETCVDELLGGLGPETEELRLCTLDSEICQPFPHKTAGLCPLFQSLNVKTRV